MFLLESWAEYHHFCWKELEIVLSLKKRNLSAGAFMKKIGVNAYRSLSEVGFAVSVVPDTSSFLLYEMCIHFDVTN